MSTIIEQANLFSSYENSKIETYLDYGARKKCVIPYDMLPEKSSGGIPVATFRDEQGKLQVIFTKETHSLIIGSTRSGKTTGFVIPMIMLKAMQKKKDSFLISDPKGELYTKCAARLKEQGYRVLLLNFRDFKKSENWNPLTPLFRKYQKAFHLHENVHVLKTEEGYAAEYDGKIYHSVEAVDHVIEHEKKAILYDVENDINVLALSVITTERSDDPYWEDTARQWLIALIFGMLEDSIPETAGDRSLITEETFSFRTLLTINDSFHFGTGSSADIHGEDGYFFDRPANSKARGYAMPSVIQNGGVTRACVLSTFNSKMAPYRELCASIITSCNSFELDELADENRPVAVFVVYRDESRTSYFVIRNFISAAYTRLIELANKEPDLQLKRPFMFLLDEFGNFPRIQDFDTTISACGGRNIWFQIILQSYAQLVNQYDAATAEIIKENLNLHMFFGTNNAETKKAFSGECGRKTIISPKSIFTGEDEGLSNVGMDEVAVLPVSKLNYLEPGECYITNSNVEAVLHSHMERSYLCEEYRCPLERLESYDATLDVFDDKYTFVRQAEIKDDDDEFDFFSSKSDKKKTPKIDPLKDVVVPNDFRSYLEKAKKVSVFQAMAETNLPYKTVKNYLAVMVREGMAIRDGALFTAVDRALIEGEKKRINKKIRVILTQMSEEQRRFFEKGLEDASPEEFLRKMQRNYRFSGYASTLVEIGLLQKVGFGYRFALSDAELEVFCEHIGDPLFLSPRKVTGSQRKRGNMFDSLLEDMRKSVDEASQQSFFSDDDDDDDDDGDDS